MSKLLEPETNAHEARLYVQKFSAILAELEAALPVLRAAARQHAGETGVREVIGKRFAMYPQPDRSDGEWAAWWADYVTVLEDVPWAALEAGMVAYVAELGSEFMPKPGRLLALAISTPNRAVGTYERAMELRRPIEPPHIPDYRETEPRIPPADQVEAVQRLFKEYKARTMPHTLDETLKPRLPSISGKPDAGGLTAAMRELITRRKEEAR